MARAKKGRRLRKGGRVEQPGHVPPNGVERRQPQIEQFALSNVQLGEVHPGEEAAVDTPQVSLLMLGQPAYITRAGGKLYHTFVSAKVAIDLGEGLLELGQKLATEGPSESTASGLLLPGSLGEAARVAQQAAAIAKLRG